MNGIAPITALSLLRSGLGVAAFVVALFVGSTFLGGIVRGQPLRDGTRRTYRLSGLVLFGATNLAVVALALGGFSLTPLLTHFASLFVVANGLAFCIVAWLMGRAWRRGRGHLFEGASRLRGALADLWLGAELNPTLFGVDLKMFAYHPSLIGLGLINLAFAFAQVERYGALSPEMVLYQAFTWSYLFTHYVAERFMLSTWDILAERFGFMLVWGDLVYVPFLYSLVGWWVMGHGWSRSDGAWVHTSPSVWALAALVAFHALTHGIFRSANWQKDRFKRDPHTRIWGKPAEALEGKLLVSGWWGVGRKINYTGEIGVYLSFALCAGFESAWPYLLPGTLVVLLTQRAWRDERRCRAKYGALWDAYCERARFRIFPFVY